ncbi:MAG: hypothetical protein AB7N65_14025 [Vicinamibacterales bacterium]
MADDITDIDSYLNRYWRNISANPIRALALLLALGATLVVTNVVTIAILLVVGVVVMAQHLILLVRRARRPLSCVLWVRKFGRGSRSRRLQYLFQIITAPFGQVITLTDQDVRGPHAAFLLVGVIVLVLPPVFFVLDRDALPAGGTLEVLLPMYVVSLFVGAVSAAAIYYRSATTVRSAQDLHRLAAQVRRIRSQRYVLWGLGAQFVNCSTRDDELWRNVIRTLAPDVDVVVVDLGEGVSTNVEWELETLLSMRGTDRVLVVAPASRAQSAVEFKRAGACAADAKMHFNVLSYPDTYPRLAWSVGRTRRLATLIRPLQRAIGVASRHNDKK